MLWFLVFACEINLPKPFVGEDGNLYEQGHHVTLDDTGGDTEQSDSAEEEENIDSGGGED